MKKILYCIVCLIMIAHATGAELFNYPSGAALRQVWREYDAGNPAPEFAEPGTMGLHIRTGKTYSILCRALPPLTAAGTDYEVELAGVSANPAGAVFTAQLRDGKEGPVLASASTPLNRDGTVKLLLVTAPKREKTAPFMLLMVTQPEEGKTVNCWVKKIDVARPERIVTGEDFSGYSDVSALLKQWHEYDAGNPRPRDITLADGKMHVNCAGLAYSLVYRNFTVPPELKVAGMRIDFRGVAGSGKVEFIVRSSRDGASLAKHTVMLNGMSQMVFLRGDALGGHKELSLLVFFHNSSGKMIVDLENVSFVAN